jgi:hypothetical protein
MTYGQIRLRLTQLLPGIAMDLIDGWIRDRYTEILDALKWQRREVRSIVQTAAPIRSGTITLTQGSTVVNGTGTGWTPTITGCGLYVPQRNEWYEVAYASATAAELDRPFEGSTLTDVTYRLYQSVYVLPDDCRILTSVQSMQGNRPLRPWQPWIDSAPAAFGSPQYWRLTMDANTVPPRQQIEVYPIPDRIESLAIEYTAEDTSFDGTAVALLPWVREGCLVAGVEADGRRYLEQFAAADRQEARFVKLLGDMQRTETARRSAGVLKVASKYNPARWIRR